MEAGAIFDLIERGGIIGLLVLIIVTGATEVWVWGKSHRRLVADLQERLRYYEDRYNGLLEANERAMDSSGPKPRARQRT